MLAWELTGVLCVCFQDERMLILCCDVLGDWLALGNRDGTLQFWDLREGIQC